MKTRNITIFADHGDHGNFLTMVLNVLTQQTDAVDNIAIFDYWQRYTQPKNFAFRFEFKVNFSQKDFNIASKKFIWMVRNDPLLWAYNICTRSILSQLPKDKNLANFTKGITIQEFENNPWEWARGSEIIGTKALNRIKKNADGSPDKESFKRWYKKSLLVPKWFQEPTPSNAIPFAIKDLHSLDFFHTALQKIESELNLDFDWPVADKLYQTLHNTLTYDIDTVYSQPTVLLEAYNEIK